MSAELAIIRSDGTDERVKVESDLSARDAIKDLKNFDHTECYIAPSHLDIFECTDPKCFPWHVVFFAEEGVDYSIVYRIDSFLTRRKAFKHLKKQLELYDLPFNRKDYIYL